MYRKEESTQIPPSNFDLPFEGKLSSDNRWVIMADLIPWAEFESEIFFQILRRNGSASKIMENSIR
ncbi:MAG TPA: hypothetical protein VE944_04195 [Nostoc sp.]|nr:hypothetical protein [Nostoc sp.]HYX13565.1 hypothetical protein [Nostoc sp.]